MKKVFPPWIAWRAPNPSVLRKMEGLMEDLKLHTICERARCPNLGVCFSNRSATFLILGDICTRRCSFCAVSKGNPRVVDPDEPKSIAEAVRRLALRYVVITSVSRDDLEDGGASQFVKVIDTLHQEIDGVVVEVLVPDFLGSVESLTAVVNSGPQVVNHNLETVPRLYREVRPGASFRRSLDLLSRVKQIAQETVTKSGLMVGLGETRDEVVGVMRELRKVHCDVLTIGQYLQPSSGHHEVATFVPPEEFREYEQIGLEMGFKGVAAGPLVRSSFRAEEIYVKIRARD